MILFFSPNNNRFRTVEVKVLNCEFQSSQYYLK
jgi:hypothetical protein